jgi:uncharacterized protein YjbJ (UPF0337 family)
MSGTADRAKGRIKEATGVLAGDDKLRREGKVDQAVGKVKDAAEKAKSAVERGADKARDAFTNKTNRR